MTHVLRAVRRIPNLLREHRWLTLILLAAFLLRLILVLRGGQLIWPDELTHFYASSHEFYILAVWERQPVEAVLHLIQQNAVLGHTGFDLVLIGFRFAIGVAELITKDSLFQRVLWPFSLILACTSVAVIALGYAIVRKAGGGKTEALLVAFLMLLSTSLLFYSRHFLPYDLATTVHVLGMWIGISERASARRSLVFGWVVGTSLFIYYGYWILGAAVIAIHVLYGGWNWREIFRRGLLTLPGLVLWPLLFEAISLVLGGARYLDGMFTFGAIARIGERTEGWSVPWAVLWYSEGLIFVVWLVGTILAAISLGRESQRPRRVVLWLAALLLVYALMVIPSVIIPWRSVYGRSVRQILPFFCLAAGYGYAVVLPRLNLRRRWIAAAAAVLAVIAAINMAPVISMRFASDMMLDFNRQFTGHRESLSEYYTIEVPWGRSAEDRGTPYVLVNGVNMFYPVEAVNPIPPGEVIVRVRHPLSYRPFMYDHYGPQARALLLSQELSVMVIRVEDQNP